MVHTAARGFQRGAPSRHVMPQRYTSWIITQTECYLRVSPRRGNLKLSEIVNILAKYYDRSACSDAYLGNNY